MDFQFPTTWQELEQIVNVGILDELAVEYKRSSRLTEQYENDRHMLSQEKSIQNIYREINASHTRLTTGEEIALTYNKYPYDLLLQNLPGVTHALFWFKGSVPIETAQAHLQSIGKTCCLYENPVALKSIPEISHYQVFLLNQDVRFPLAAA
ncbi:MAG: DUF3605 domain-containing protein [Cyanobacteria bacterium RM1_2_2]|nr:DUF3605 domain-containing protein [Cyanobacteria bacterium RM1_2_2]